MNKKQTLAMLFATAAVAGLATSTEAQAKFCVPNGSGGDYCGSPAPHPVPAPPPSPKASPEVVKKTA